MLQVHLSIPVAKLVLCPLESAWPLLLVFNFYFSLSNVKCGTPYSLVDFTQTIPSFLSELSLLFLLMKLLASVKRRELQIEPSTLKPIPLRMSLNSQAVTLKHTVTHKSPVTFLGSSKCGISQFQKSRI